MTKTDFAELKEKLLDESSDLLMALIIISELIEIIKIQSEALKEVNTDNFVYDDHCTDIGDRIDQCEIETTTRLQKLRDGNNS